MVKCSRFINAAVLTAIFCVGGSLWAGTYSGGTGGVTNPYKIARPADWQELMTTPADWSEHFVLTAHLDLMGVTLTPVGNSTAKFTGVFDGAGYSIYNAVMNQPDGNYVALFGYTWPSAVIRNVRLKNAAITGKFWVGGLVGSTGGTTIENVGVDGTVTGVAHVGAIAGLVSGTTGNISRCYSTGSITASRYAGGLVGYIWGATLENCYSQVSIIGVEDVLGGDHRDLGGLIGRTYETTGYVNTVNACYAAGSISAAAGVVNVGGLVGLHEGGMFTNCFWDTQVSGQATSPVGIGKTTAQMKRRTTFASAGWDFVGVWADGQNQAYPFLRMRPAADINGDGLVKLEDFAILAAQWLTGSPVIADYDGIEWVAIRNSGFNGQMSRYETTNAQFAQYLNAALASGDIAVSGDGNYAVGANGSNGGQDFVGQNYYRFDGPGSTGNGATNGGKSRISYSGGTFTVDSGFENHPVTYVSWYGAMAFASYYGWRLPTEWEWEAVASYDGAYTYGSGNTLYDSQRFLANCRANGHNGTAPDDLPYHPWVEYGTSEVGYLGTCGYGMADMAGNVWEWTSSLQSSESSEYIFRGGSWRVIISNCEVSYRGHHESPDRLNHSEGFRVCR
jgi:formylglycine-generating enzyme required for sulfatase activity